MTRLERLREHAQQVRARAAEIAADWKSGAWTIRRLSTREQVGQDVIREIIHSQIPPQEYGRISRAHVESTYSRGRKFPCGNVPWIKGRHVLTRPETKLPIGTIRVRRHKLRKDDEEGSPRYIYRRFIKVSNRGNRHRRWLPYCQWVWELHHGRKVPPGKFVVHKDGKTMNDDPKNLMLMDLAGLARWMTKTVDTVERGWRSWETQWGEKRMAEAREEKRKKLAPESKMSEWEPGDDGWDDQWSDEEAA